MNFNNIFGKINPSYNENIKEMPNIIKKTNKYFLLTFLKLIVFPLNKENIKLVDIESENKSIMLNNNRYIKPDGKKYAILAV